MSKSGSTKSGSTLPGIILPGLTLQPNSLSGIAPGIEYEIDLDSDCMGAEPSVEDLGNADLKRDAAEIAVMNDGEPLDFGSSDELFSNQHPQVAANSEWTRIRNELKSELDPQMYQAYIKPLRFVEYSINSNSIILEAPSRFVKQQLDGNLTQEIQKKCTSSFGTSASVVISSVVLNNQALNTQKHAFHSSLDPTPPSGGLHASGDLHAGSLSQTPGRDGVRGDSNELSKQDNGNASRPLTFDDNSYVVVKRVKTKKSSGDQPTERVKDRQPSGIIPRYTFSNFVVGAGNQFCHAASLRVAESPGGAYNPLFIYGGVGLGKTHLLHAIGNAVLAKFPDRKVLYLSSESFTNELIQSLRFGKMDEFKNRFRNIDLLLIDDIQFMCGKERTQEEFFHTFNALYSAKHQIVITSDKLPQDIPGLEERLQTRFAWGLTADIQAPDFETRVAILKRKAALDSFILPESVAHLIAESVSSNVRELEGALTRLHALSSLQDIDITKELAESALGPILKKRKVHLTIEEIQKVVAEHFSIKVSEMVSKLRTRKLSFPRHIAMYLCRKHTTSSFPEIGTKFGGRDHSSVIHAANVVATKLKDSNEVKKLIDQVERKLLE